MTYEDGLYNGIDIYGNKFTECQHCGNKEYYWHVCIHGSASLYNRFDNEEADNSAIHANLSYIPTGDWAYCSDCRKAIFKWRI